MVLAGLVITGNASAIPTTNIIQGDACDEADVTATGYGSADQCIGLLDKEQGEAGAGPNDSEDFFNNMQVFNDGATIWGATGAFGHNEWMDLGKHDQGSTYDFINVTNGNPNGSWIVDLALSGTFLIAVKQSNELGLWYFEDLDNVTGGDLFINNIFGSGFDGDAWSHVAIYQTSSSVPEPSVVALLSVGLLGLVFARRRIHE